MELQQVEDVLLCERVQQSLADIWSGEVPLLAGRNERPGVPGRDKKLAGRAAEVSFGQGVERTFELERIDLQLLPPGQGERHAVRVLGEGEIRDVGRSQEERERLGGRRALAV